MLGAARRGYNRAMSWPWLVVFVLAAALVVAVEWPRLGRRFSAEARRERDRKQRKSRLRVISSDDEESDEFIRSVQRDLDELPTIEEHDRKT
jgi:flagellar biosynthesis/type III secretory pathway M-ring protein FliF/YscJ